MDERFGPAAMAIIVGEHDQLKELLDNDPDLVSKPSSVSHPTLLQLVACEASNLVDPVGAAQVLIDAGAELQGPLVAAAGCGAGTVMALLLDCGADINKGAHGNETWSPLDEALYWSNDEIAKELLARGAQIRSLSTAAGLGDCDALANLLDSEATSELRSNAAPIGSPFPDTIPQRLARNPQSMIDHAFVMAVNNAQLPAAQFLLERGARVNAFPPGYHWHGTALHAAASIGDRSIVTWLLANGADPSIRDALADSDAAGWAEHHGYPELAELLTTPAETNGAT